MDTVPFDTERLVQMLKSASTMGSYRVKMISAAELDLTPYDENVFLLK